MTDLDDLALLREYAARGSEAAFAELVSRRVNFVYSSALRQVRNSSLAEEIAQAVFIILAQKAGKVSGGGWARPLRSNGGEDRRRGAAATSLAGWLFKTTRFVALAQMRAEIKRARQQKEFQMQSQIDSGTGFQPVSETDELWSQMSPLLDEALAALAENDRQAVLLRFFEKKSLADVGSALGIGEDTARKRVSRALEKLHRHFAKRGVTSTTADLAEKISAHSIQAAPAALAKSVTAVALAKGATASVSTLTLIKGALKIMAWTKAKTAIVAGAVVLLTAGTMTVVHEIHWRHTYYWRINGIDKEDVDNLPKLPPQVWVKPAMSTHYPNNLGLGTNGMLMGRAVPLSWLIRDAYGKTQPWMIFKDGLNDDHSYDFMANLPQDSSEALRREINKALGISIHYQMIETNVLVLKIGKGGVHDLLAPDYSNKADMMVDKDAITWFAKPLSTLNTLLEMYGRIPIVDQTGLTNIYRYSIPWDSNWRFGTPGILDEIEPSLAERYGIELVATNMPIEMLVVEKVK